MADPSSEAAVPGLVDQAQFARAQQAIVQACESLLNPASTQEQVRERERENHLLIHYLIRY